MGSDSRLFQRLQYTGARGDVVCVCVRKKETMKGEEKEREKKGVGRRWEIDWEKNLGKHVMRRLYNA